MTFQCPIGPPPVPQDAWQAKFWAWLCKVWFPKQRALGTGLEHDSQDRVSIDTSVVATVPTGTGFPHITAGVQDAAAKLVENADVHASAAIALSKLADIGAGFLAGGDGGGSGEIEPITVGSALSMAATTLDVALNGIGNTLLRNSGALSVIGRSANSTGDPADISATAASGAVLRESGSVLGFGTIVAAGIASDAVTTAKIINDAVTDAKLRDSAAVSVIGRSANSSGDPADIAAGTNGHVLARSSNVVGFVDPQIPDDIWVHWIMFDTPRYLDANTGTLAVSNPSIDSATDYDGHVVLFNLVDAQFRYVAFSMIAPDDLDITQSLRVSVYYRLSGAPVAAAAVDIDLTARAVADNEVTASGGKLVTVGGAKTVDAHASGDLVIHDLGEVFAANDLSVGDYIKGVVGRDATAGNASDTYTGTAQLIGIKFLGTRLKITL